jgi:ABC-type nitrate/sulfonate/bicarbonate transport system permease component
MKIHEEIQRHWPWYLLALGLTLTGSVVGYFIGGLLGLLVGTVIGLVAVPVGERGVTRVREIERGREGDAP